MVGGGWLGDGGWWVEVGGSLMAGCSNQIFKNG